MGRDGGDDTTRHLLLYCEDILEHAIIFFSPDMRAAQGVDQLRRYAHLTVGPSDAALDDITNAEVPSDRPDIH